MREERTPSPDADDPSVQRSQSLFEDFPGHPTLPLPELQSPWAPDVATTLRVEDTPLVRATLRAAFFLTGFGAFHRRIAGRFDRYLQRKDDYSTYAPVFAAVQALADEPADRDPFHRAASLLRAAWDLHADIRGGRFAPDSSSGHLLESRGYLNLFGANLVCDGEGFRLFKTPCTTRVLVVAKRRMFALDLAFDRTAPSRALLVRALRDVWTSCLGDATPADQPSVGEISCAKTTTQLAALRVMLRDPANRASFDITRHAFLTICLEMDAFPSSDADAAAVAFSGDFASRWFHSNLQIVVFGNGKACQLSNGNAGVTGNVMMRAASELHRRATADAGRDADDPAARGTASIRELHWSFDQVRLDKVRADVAAARDSQQATFDIPELGRTALEARGVRPVELFVIALQAAAYRLTGRLVSIRQFVTTARYRCGAFTTADVSTPEMAALQRALVARDASRRDLRRLFDEAAESQRRACRAERGRIKVPTTLRWYREGLTGVRSRYVELVMKVARTLVPEQRERRADIVISHPVVVPDVPIVGRPGVRVPYVDCFALHYQIFDDRTTVTVMPGVRWSVPNVELMQALTSSLTEILDLVAADDAASAPRPVAAEPRCIS